jgi:NifB/MoaA-like Fe-S oxidoreductase
MPAEAECSAALAAVERMAARSLEERGRYWVYGSDELYLKANTPLPPAERYDDFEQLENGVGVVRYFQQQVEEFDTDLSGNCVGIVTGTAMGKLFSQILDDFETRTHARFELIVQQNDLFGPSVTTAGLLPGSAFVSALKGRRDLDLALIPAEALNDDNLFLDDVSFSDLQDRCSVEVKASHWIVDAFTEGQR